LNHWGLLKNNDLNDKSSYEFWLSGLTLRNDAELNVGSCV
jgi:hypothetical protein